MRGVARLCPHPLPATHTGSQCPLPPAGLARHLCTRGPVSPKVVAAARSLGSLKRTRGQRRLSGGSDDRETCRYLLSAGHRESVYESRASPAPAGPGGVDAKNRHRISHGLTGVRSPGSVACTAGQSGGHWGVDGGGGREPQTSCSSGPDPAATSTPAPQRGLGSACPSPTAPHAQARSLTTAQSNLPSGEDWAKSHGAAYLQPAKWHRFLEGAVLCLEGNGQILPTLS